MKQKAIALLQQQIDKLAIKDFDLVSWKAYTLVILARIFGENDIKLSQIQALEFEFSSWSLRDASGNESYEEGTKKLAREIIQAGIDEIIVFGIPEQASTEPDQQMKEMLNCLLDELKGSQLKSLKSILSSKVNKEEKRRQLKEMMETLGEYTAYEVLINMLLQTAAIKILKK